MQERLDVYQRTGEPCRRCGRPIRRIVIGIRATHFCSWCQRLPAAQRPAAAPLLRTMTPRPGAAAASRKGRRWVELDGRRGARPHDRRGGPRPSPHGTHQGGRRGPPRGGTGGERLVSLVRLDGVTREIGTFVILDRITGAIAPGERVGLVGPNGAGKTTLLRIVSGRDEPERGDGRAQAWPEPRAAQPGGALRRGVHGRAGPARRRAPRRGAPRAHGRGARPSSSMPGTPPARTTPSSSTASTSSAGTRWTSAWTRR